jgi:antitoxin component YwqK of YwqJK toxin-antitoxin module
MKKRTGFLFVILTLLSAAHVYGQADTFRCDIVFNKPSDLLNYYKYVNEKDFNPQDCFQLLKKDSVFKKHGKWTYSNISYSLGINEDYVGRYSYGLKTGKWYRISRNTDKIEEIDYYTADKLDSIKQLYPDGSVYSALPFNKGKLNGFVKFYDSTCRSSVWYEYRDDTLLRKIPFKNGKRNGFSPSYSNGMPTGGEIYRNDTLETHIYEKAQLAYPDPDSQYYPLYVLHEKGQVYLNIFMYEADEPLK